MKRIHLINRAGTAVAERRKDRMKLNRAMIFVIALVICVGLLGGGTGMGQKETFIGCLEARL